MQKSFQMMAIAAAGAALMTAAPSHAGNQSSNTSSNSSSNNGIVRERVVDTYCDNDDCQRVVSRRTYRDGEGWVYRDGKRYRKLNRVRDDYRRYERRDRDRFAGDDDNGYRDERRRGSDRDDDDDDDD